MQSMRPVSAVLKSPPLRPGVRGRGVYLALRSQRRVTRQSHTAESHGFPFPQELSHAAIEMYASVGRTRSAKLVGKDLAEFYM